MKAIIGAAFGDEGKGLMTDYLASKDSIVVRYNGGCQAGHTVREANRRHVFGHIGSGTFRGASTFLAKEFICNPMLFFRETLMLPNPPVYDVFVHEDCRITTRLDMTAGRFRERNVKHGSCGVGIFQTIERDKIVPLRVKHLLDGSFDGILRDICDYYKDPYSYYSEIYQYCRRFSEAVTVVNDYKLLKDNADGVVFEGAQGLLLDERHQFFPYITPSRPGLSYIADILKAIGFTDVLDVVYVLRTYMTRHGPGPFPSESQTLSFHDATNNENEWQGKLRFGTLDIPLIHEAITKDISDFVRSCDLSVKIALTHCDQLDRDDLPWNVGYKSFGPTREDVRCVI